MKKNSVIATLAIILAATIAIVIVAASIYTNSKNSPVEKYRTEAVRILEKYKDFDIDSKEAAQRIGELRDEVYKEKSETKNVEEQHDLLDLWLDLLDIHTKLYHNGSATGYEIDEAIKAIK